MVFSKSAKALFAIFLFSSLSYSQWYQQNSGVTTQLNSVFFLNQNTGIIASDSGKILRTTDGGNGWSVMNVLGSTVFYKTVYFYDQSTGYIAGRILDLIGNIQIKPIIIKTTNSGLNWFSVLNDTAYTLKSIYFINPNTGFATGGLYALATNYLLTTTNAGANWVRSSPGMGYLWNITFKDALTGYMPAVQGYIYRSTNMGLNWNFFNSVSGVFQLTAISFVDANVGFMTGGNLLSGDSLGNIYKTTDGGNNWALVFSDHKGMFNCVKFVSSNIGFAVGSLDNDVGFTIPGRIVKTTNSGSGWFIDTAFTNIIGLNSLFFQNTLTGYVVGGNGVILKTTTGGNPLGIIPISSNVPKQFSLSQNYPNPFNPITTIKFNIPKESFTKLSVYDLLGNEVLVLVDRDLKAGEYSVSFNAANLAGGIYFYKLEALPAGSSTGDFISTKKLVILK